MRFLEGSKPIVEPARPGGVSVALEHMDAGDGREALQLIECESQRTIHQAVDEQTMLPGVDARREVMEADLIEVEPRRRNDPHLILKRIQPRCQEGSLSGDHLAQVTLKTRGHA